MKPQTPPTALLKCRVGLRRAGLIPPAPACSLPFLPSALPTLCRSHVQVCRYLRLPVRFPATPGSMLPFGYILGLVFCLQSTGPRSRLGTFGQEAQRSWDPKVHLDRGQRPGWVCPSGLVGHMQLNRRDSLLQSGPQSHSSL